MKNLILFSLMCLLSVSAVAQFRVSDPRSWNRYPPEVQKPGFGLVTSRLVQMDDSKEDEEVFLFSADNGHYPDFDIFKCYYVVVGNYSKEVKYISTVTRSTLRDLVLEDRNQDGIYELYRRYMKDDKFSVDANGEHLITEWVYDKIEWHSQTKKIK